MIAALYEDEEILVLDKPAGLASQPGAEVRISLVEAVERDYGFRPFLVHRLDKETTGCIIVARDAKAASRWAALVESRSLRKVYRAVVAGAPRGTSGVLEESVSTRGVEKSARTEWRLLASFADAAPEGESPKSATLYSYLELELGTGRTHQIRLHLAGAGMPILGDDRHGDFPLNKRLRKDAGLRRLLLHARALSLPGGRLVTAPAPEHLRDFLARFPLAPDPECP
jgi:23S rRNA pseudouridine955/2504/2580 synthase